MACGIIRRAGEPLMTGSVSYLALGHIAQRCEFCEPTRYNRPHLRVRRQSQETVAFAKLAVLVPAADDECAIQFFLLDGERHVVQGVLRIDQ